MQSWNETLERDVKEQMLQNFDLSKVLVIEAIERHYMLDLDASVL